MNAHAKRSGWLRRLAALALALLTAGGPLAGEAAAQVAAAAGAAPAAAGASASGAAALSAGSPAASLPLAIAPLSAPLSGSPSAASPRASASASAAAASASAVASAAETAEEAPVLAAAAAAADPALAPAAEPAAPLGLGASAAAPAAAPARAAAPAGLSPALARTEFALDAPLLAEQASDGARRSFAALLGERLFRGRGEIAATSAAVPASSPSSPLRGLVRSRAKTWAARAGIVLAALPLIGYAAPQNGVPAPTAAWHAVSQTGYIAGNVAAAAFPLFQIHAAFKGKRTPGWRAVAGVVASLGLMVSAALLHESLWGIQNLFGGLTLFAPLMIKHLPKGFLAGGALRNTAIVSAALLAVTVGLYFPLSAAAAAIAHSALSAHAVTGLMAGIQWATTGLFLSMFVPDTIQMLRGKNANPFDKWFNLSYFLTMVAFLLWSFPLAWTIPGAAHATYQVIFATTAIEAVLGFISYVLSRRVDKNSAPPKG